MEPQDINKQEYPPMHTDGPGTSITEDLIGDIHKIDLSYTLEENVYLVLVCAGYMDGSPEIQKALLDKMEGYLNHIHSDWFKQEYAGLKAVVVVCFDEVPHQLILQLLTKCIPWFEEYGVELKFKLKDVFFYITTENRK
ncbi:MAG: hypothetical protein IJK84_07080 [Bacteroidales bacterium]|nr:hypothetical protein [Bacteroidales bacterium]